MKNYISELIEIGMGSVIDTSTDKFIMEDEVYRIDSKNAYEIQERFVDMLTTEQKTIFEDYIACIMSANERACNLSYLVGARNTIQFLSEIDAIKDDSGR